MQSQVKDKVESSKCEFTKKQTKLKLKINPSRAIAETHHIYFQNDTLLSESSHFTFVYDDNECSLVILNACSEDSGVYTCTARNLAGSVSCKAELTVHEGKELIHQSHKKCIIDNLKCISSNNKITD